MGKHQERAAHVVLVLLLAVHLGGCAAAARPAPPTGRSGRPEVPGRSDRPEVPGRAERTERPVGEFSASEPFQLSLTAAGSFKPGEPVQLTLRATSTYASSEGQVGVSLMEVAAGEDCGWASEIRIPMDEAVRRHIHVRKPLVRGETVERTVTITIPEAGYYTVNVVGFRPSEPPMVPNVSTREYGLLITPDGGRLTGRFDAGLIPPGMRMDPGPFTPETVPARIRTVDAGQGCVVGTPA